MAVSFKFLHDSLQTSNFLVPITSQVSPLIYPEVLEHLVNQRNCLAHEYQHAIKPMIDWECVMNTSGVGLSN